MVTAGDAPVWAVWGGGGVREGVQRSKVRELSSPLLYDRGGGRPQHGNLGGGGALPL